MRRAPESACLALALWPMIAVGGEAPPAPDLDCSLGFEGLRAFATALPGARVDDETATIRTELPAAWRVEFAFSNPGDPAHPAVTLRTFIKQVTGVWTAQSKGCGFGDQSQFMAVMTDMKAGDKALTEASRGQVEQQKKMLSPLAPP